MPEQDNSMGRHFSTTLCQVVPKSTEYSRITGTPGSSQVSLQPMEN